MKENNRNKDELFEKIYELAKDFEGLTREQRELLLCRKLIETGKVIDNSKGFPMITYNQSINVEDRMCLIGAADVSFFKPIMVYSMRDKATEYQKVYSESLVHYNKVLENYKKLAEELGVSSALGLSHLFAYMLWNGYFSVTKEHVYKVQERLMLPGMFSFDVIKGRGVCLAYSELLHNYLFACGKKSSILSCKVPMGKDDISCDYNLDIERHMQNNVSSKMLSAFMTIFLGGLMNKVGNHAITLIGENEKLFAYDSTNLFGLNIINSSKASIINGKGEFQIKPLTTLMLYPNSDPYHLYEKLLSGNIEPALDREEFIFGFENIMELINSNISLLNDSYESIHSDLEYIDKETDKIGGIRKVLKK